MSEPTAPSLLYPPGGARAPSGHPAPSEADLGLASIARALDYDGRHSRFVAAVLAELNTDPATIRFRQDVLADLLANPDLAARCAALLPQLAELANAGRPSHWSDPIPLVQVGARLAELDAYLTCVDGLALALAAESAKLASAGLLALRDYLETARATPEYRRLAAELPNLRAQLDQAGSVTLGINLDGQLRPESATVVSINAQRFGGKATLIERLFGERAAADAIRGITALYKAEEGRQRAPEHELFRDLSRLLERVAAPIADALGNYARINGAGLAALAPELAFYLGAARLASELSAAGLPLCRPMIAPAAERACTIDELYSLDLALRLRLAEGDTAMRQKVVPNRAWFGEHASVFLLTGPNSGGKTTYVRAVGQAHVLAQAGLLVPGRSARISPIDACYTHFAAPERADISGGRLAEELDRLARIFQQAGPQSLVLLNEPLASTDHGAARALCRDILAGLLLLGARAIFVTHLYELVDDALDGEAAAPGVASLVAGVGAPPAGSETPAPNYHIAPGRPQPAGYAAELARRHGLGRAQIAATLRQRGLISGENS
ncbi:MutS-related protein [Kouleothrix sp.]|uniref:MutS-related protein n=1 Tax=Kouleothrix sp. TaxID=2779161 RepID=UPI00391A4D9D